MTSMRGVDPYHFLEQTQAGPQFVAYTKLSEKPKIDANSVFGFLKNNSDYSIITYIIKCAQKQDRINDLQFNSTFFVAKDEDILKSISMDKIMNLERSEFNSIVLRSMLNRKISLKSFEQRIVSIIDTSDRSYNLEFINTKEGMYINGAKILGEKQFYNGNIVFVDRLVC